MLTEEIYEREVTNLNMYFLGNMLWRFLCGIVLLGIILFAGKVMYSSMQAGKLDWYILSSEEGRYI